MSSGDVDACSNIFDRALGQLRNDLGLARDAQPAGVARERIAHVLATDPIDSVVIEVDGSVAGFAQATRRGDCWVLVHLFVTPDEQSAGIGRALLADVHSRSTSLGVGFIGATADPRAMRAYSRLPGFRLHPTVRAEGRVVNRPAAEPMVKLLPRADALEQAAHVDSRVRGAARTSDLLHLLDSGYEIRSIADRGYAIASPTSVATLAASDDAAAAALLNDALSRVAEDAELELPRMTAEQEWAIDAVVRAGLRLRPWGPLMVRGVARPPAPYLPHPALC